MRFFLHTQKCDSKEEAFLKGYLMAAGGEKHLISIVEVINWDLIKKDPSYADIEKRRLEIAVEVANKTCRNAMELAEKYGVSYYGDRRG